MSLELGCAMWGLLKSDERFLYNILQGMCFSLNSPRCLCSCKCGFLVQSSSWKEPCSVTFEIHLSIHVSSLAGWWVASQQQLVWVQELIMVVALISFAPVLPVLSSWESCPARSENVPAHGCCGGSGHKPKQFASCWWGRIWKEFKGQLLYSRTHGNSGKA